jgi:hypothetical protein
MASEQADLDRRQLIKLGAAATVAASLGIGDAVADQASQATAKAFFTPDEFAVVDELSELIIPTDAHSPGARAAKVAAFIDGQLAEAWEDKPRTDWREGLRLVDRISRDSTGKSFMQSSADERLAVLTRIAQNESQPKKPEELFFAELKSKVVHAYYTSEIGIKQEMEYQGNSYLPEFAGTDVSQPNK